MKKATNYLAAALVAAAIFIGSSAKAQTTTPATSADPNPWRLGIGIEGGIPTGSYHAPSNFELGGSLRLQYDVTSAFAVTATSGYTNFFVKDSYQVPGGPSGLHIIPAKVGVKWFFVPGLYVAGEAGAGFETDYSKSTKLILSPALGWANEHWDVGVNYTNYSGQSNNFGSVGLRLAYGFGL